MTVLEDQEIAEVRARLQLVGAPTAWSVTLGLEIEGNPSIARTSSFPLNQRVEFAGNGTAQQFEFHPKRPGIHRFVASLTDTWQRKTVSAELEVDVPILTILSLYDSPYALGMGQLKFVPSVAELRVADPKGGLQTLCGEST